MAEVQIDRDGAEQLVSPSVSPRLVPWGGILLPVMEPPRRLVAASRPGVRRGRRGELRVDVAERRGDLADVDERGLREKGDGGGDRSKCKRVVRRRMARARQMSRGPD